MVWIIESSATIWDNWMESKTRIYSKTTKGYRYILRNWLWNIESLKKNQNEQQKNISELEQKYAELVERVSIFQL